MDAKEIRARTNAKVDVPVLIEMRRSGVASYECAKHFKVNSRVIRRILDEMGVPRVIKRNIGVCECCGKNFKKTRRGIRFCSIKCAANRTTLHLSVPEVTNLYITKGLSQKEVAAALGTTQAVIHKFMRRHNIPTRTAAKRNQKGPNNDYWKGNSVSYKGAHQRVRAEKGEPEACEHCGATAEEKRLEWANLSGKFHDPNDYIPLCVKCHRGFDAKKRKEDHDASCTTG